MVVLLVGNNCSSHYIFDYYNISNMQKDKKYILNINLSAIEKGVPIKDVGIHPFFTAAGVIGQASSQATAV